MLTTKSRALISLLLGCLVVQAGTLTYNFQLQTSEGYEVTDITMFAAGEAGNDDIFFSPSVVPPSGPFQLQQVTTFNATRAMIIGLMERNQDDNMHLVMWVSDSFAQAVQGILYSAVFPAANSNPRHNDWPAIIRAAASGDAASLGTLYDFFRRSHQYDPLFDPSGSFSIIEFSPVGPPIGGDIPEPATLSMVGAAAIVLLIRAAKGTKLR